MKKTHQQKRGDVFLEKSEKDKVEASCVSCIRDHLITVKSMFNEAVRMSHSRPISDSEIQFRINKAEEELNAMERGDLTPTKVAALPEDERKIVEDIASRARSGVRHQLEATGLRWGRGSEDDLRRVAVSAENIEKDFRERMTPIMGKKFKSYNELLGKIEEIIKKKTTTTTTEKSEPLRNSRHPIISNVPRPWEMFEELRPRHYLEMLRKTAKEGTKTGG